MPDGNFTAGSGVPLRGRRAGSTRPPAHRATRYARPIQELLFGPWILLPLAILLGAFIASQVFHITARYIKLLFGMSIIFALLRAPLSTSLCLFAVVFTVPTAVFLGNTNVFLIGALLVIWIARVRLRQLPPAIPSQLDWAISFYLGFHLLSFINVDSSTALKLGLQTMGFTIPGVVLFFLLFNGLRSEDHLHSFLKALCLCALFIDITAIYERITGGRQLVPVWFLAGGLISQRDRIGGVFGSHALLADFSAMLFYLQVMLGMRSRSRAAKLYYYGLAVLGIVMISFTVNRGGAVGWLLGGLIFLWFYRRRIRWSWVIVTMPVLLLLLGTLNFMGSHRVLDLGIISRLSHSQFVRGIPETRVKAWTDIWARIPEHFWIGHGPYYDLRSGRAVGIIWPHSAYLFYFYTIGLFGLLAWLWILGKLLWQSHPRSSIDFARVSLPRATLAVTHVQLLIFAAAQIRTDHQRGNVYVYFMWILFGVSAIAFRLVQEERARAAISAPSPAPNAVGRTT